MTPAEEAEALRVATREAHEAMKDIRAAVKAAHGVLTEIRTAAEVAVQERLGDAIKAGLDEFETALTTSIDKAEAAVQHRFDVISDLLLGEERSQVRRGEPSILALAETKVDVDRGWPDPPEGYRWLSPQECHGNQAFCTRCSPRNPDRRKAPL